MEAYRLLFPLERSHMDTHPQAHLQLTAPPRLGRMEPPQPHQRSLHPRALRLAPESHSVAPPEPEGLKSPRPALKPPALNDFAVHGFAKPLPSKPLDCNAGVSSASINISLTGETRIPQTRHSPLATRHSLPVTSSAPRGPGPLMTQLALNFE